MTKNSHIQITQGILRGFSHKTSEGNKVFYLDLNDFKIKEEKIRILGSKEFYYNEQNERYLSVIEKNFGEATAKIKMFGKGTKEKITLDQSDCKNIKRFFNYTFVRSEKNLDEVNRYSVASKILGNMKHDELIELVKSDEKSLSYFKDFKINVIINKTSKEFITLRSVYYLLKKHEYNREMYIMPLNGKVAIAMIHNDDYHKYENKEGVFYLSINDENSVQKMNEIALRYEQKQNDEFIVGNMNELKRLKLMVEMN